MTTSLAYPESYPSGWHVWLVFRRWIKHDSWPTWKVALCTGSTIIHVEFLFRAILKNPSRLRIPDHQKVDKQKDNVHTRVQKGIQLKKIYHQLAALPRRCRFGWYSVDCTRPEQIQEAAVHMIPNKQYHAGSKRFFVKLPLLRDAVVCLWNFLEAQVGKPFNLPGETWNFYPCLGYRYGCQSAEEIKRAPSWFCSELATAALQSVGLFKEEQTCLVSPARLAALVASEFVCAEFLEGIPNVLKQVVVRQ
jgi:hypothetical protein